MTSQPRIHIEEILPRLFAEEELHFFGCADLDLSKEALHLAQWLDDGQNAGMKYMETSANLRTNPKKLMPEARSAIIFGLNYFSPELLRTGSKPRVAAYARYRDYHKVMRRSGEAVLTKLIEFSALNIRGRVIVDSVPILERALAAKAAGFIGKNSCFIDPKEGSFFLLGEILVDIDLNESRSRQPVDHTQRHPEFGGCGSCQRCQIHCPTGALHSDYTVDARRCLAYWTIEHRGPIPEEFWPWLGEYYFGCDICQKVCPYNRQAQEDPRHAKLRVKSYPTLDKIAIMNQREYELYFGGTPMTRAKREGLRRNALIAMAVIGDPNLAACLAYCKEGDTTPTLLQTVAQIEAKPLSAHRRLTKRNR